jgi:phosphatidylserine/phosphatidylglycerophosphate/cardiolipin synthase-like enzyme
MNKLITLITTLALSFSAQAFIGTCFTPGENCTDKLVQVINLAETSIKVQAYSFTSKPIIDALIAAHHRGVDVRIILDKSQFLGTGYLAVIQAGIPVWIDLKPAIAHNKVMIFDNESLETGSFNYSDAAQYKNAENMLVTDEEKPINAYLANWKKRLTASVTNSAYATLRGNK